MSPVDTVRLCMQQVAGAALGVRTRQRVRAHLLASAGRSGGVGGGAADIKALWRSVKGSRRGDKLVQREAETALAEVMRSPGALTPPSGGTRGAGPQDADVAATLPPKKLWKATRAAADAGA